MLRTITLTAILAVGCAAAYGETFTGRLLDANCAAKQANAYCTPTDTTTAFALQVSGKTLKLDAEGNRMAAEAVKANNNSADRAKDPNAPVSQLTAKVEGTLSGDELKAQSVQIE